MALQRSQQTPPRVTGESSDVEVLRDQLQQLQSALRSHTELHRILEESEGRYRELFERVQTGIYRMSVQGRLLLANRALLRIFGLPNISAAKSAEKFYIKADSRRAFLEEIERTGEISGREMSYRINDGSIIHVRESARAIRDNHGRTLYYEGVIEDLTPLRRSEKLGRDSHHILQSLGENRPLAEVLAEISEMVARQWTGSVSMILSRAEDGQFLLADCNRNAVAREVLHHRILNEAAISGTPCILLNLSLTAAAEFASAWSVPVVSGEQALLGCLTVLHRFSRPPEAAELLSLETAARLTAFAFEQQKLQKELDHFVNYDSLTQLPNRHLLQQRLEMALCSAQANGHRVALLSLDVDHFKIVNDQFGHRYGDALLQAFAERLAGQAGTGHFIARPGADEFTLLLPCINDASEADTLAARLVDLCTRPLPCLDQELFATASVGIAVYPDDAADAAALQSHAEFAMYLAKSRGRSTFQRFQKAEACFLQRRAGLEISLRQALERNELELYYQPQVDIHARLCGFEALLRWNHPKDGVLTPAHFLPIAEQSGLIVPIGEWVIGEAVKQLVAWRTTGVSGVPVSVNVSTLQLYRSWLPGVVEQKLLDSGVPPEWLAIELTESLVMHNSEQATEQLNAIRELGMKVAIDDFGTGYSSLSYLQHLPADVLKIDRSFVSGLGSHDERASAIVRAIIGLARTFQLQVTAEGVETREQHRELAELGVDKFQGFLFARPMPAGVVPILADLNFPLRS